MTTLVTGASGFIGTALCEALLLNGMPVRGAIRTSTRRLASADFVEVGGISTDTDWTGALRGVRRVVHLAARVHVMREHAVDPLSEFRRINVDATESLARQAAAAGVNRFIYLSSIKVHGESTEPGRPFMAEDEPAPADSYGISKLEAERSLRRVADRTGMEVVIIRPPLVYGPGVRANFESMMRWLARGVPLPLAAVTENRRSMVSLDNLVDLIVACLNHSAAANQTLLVSDDEDLATAELLNRMGQAMGRRARLFCVPLATLKLVAGLLNQDDVYRRLCGSLEVDISKTKRLLDWSPRVTVDEGLRRTAAGFCR